MGGKRNYTKVLHTIEIWEEKEIIEKYLILYKYGEKDIIQKSVNINV